MTAANTPRPAGLPTGLRVLVVEDEMLIGLFLEDVLQELGCKIIGPVGQVAEAIPLANMELLDAAILDVNVAGVEVFPVACALARRAIPFVFVSGYRADRLPKEWRNRPILEKPYKLEDVERCLGKALLPSNGNADSV